MKNALRNAHRWLRQARYDLTQAERLREAAVFSYAAFFAEQAAQKALKAFLLSRGARRVVTPSVGQLTAEAAALESGFLPLVPTAPRLDRHYLTSR